MLARSGVLVLCVIAAVVLAGRRSDDAACRAALRAPFAGTQPAGPALATTMREKCHDVDQLASGAVTMLMAGRRDDAVALARTATRRGPDVFAAWVALEAALRRGHPRAARRAEARARALNPRWSGPAPLPGPPAGAAP